MLPSRSQPSLPPGRVIDEHYEILEVLGQGSAGTVYRARDLHVDAQHEIVALKAIHPQFYSDRQIHGRFKREADIMMRLQGPHLCPLLELVEDDGVLMLAMEYVPGVSLDELLRERPMLSHEEVVLIVRQVCEALSEAHDVGVVHRDLKPSNVLIEGAPSGVLREGDLKVRVVDFGLAKIISGEASGTVLTEQDMIFGTPNYMAPEQVAGEELDERCDVYAAAAMTFEMLVGTPVFDTPGPLTTMAAHLNQPVPYPSERAPDSAISAALDAVLMRGLAKDRSERYQSAQAFAEALSRAFAQPDEEALPDIHADIAMQVGDTLTDAAARAANTTMASDLSGSTGPIGRGAKVRVRFSEARPASVRQPSTPSTPPLSLDEDARERRVWWGVAIVVAILAVGLGIALGVS